MRLRLAASGLAVTLAACLLTVPSAQAVPTEAPLAHGDLVASSGDLLLTWDGVAGAAGYKVEVAADESFTTILESATTPSLRYAPLKQLVGNLDRTLYWHVAAYDTSPAALGPFSDTQLVVRTKSAAPVPVAPANGSTVAYPSPVVFSWDSVPGAFEYALEYSQDDSFSSPTSVKTKSTTYSPAGLLARATWYWRVRAVLESGTGAAETAQSASSSFTVTWPTAASQPTQVAPVDGSTMSDVEFRWLPVPGAAYYKLDVATDESFTSLVLDGTTVFGSRYVPDAPLNNATYWWRVTAYDAADQPGSASLVGSFRRVFGPQQAAEVTDPAILEADYVASAYPVPSLTSQTVAIDKLELSWSPLPRATFYQVEVVAGGSFTVDPKYVLTCTTPNTSVTPFVALAQSGASASRLTFPGASCLKDRTDIALTPGTTYSWRVRAVDLAATSTASIQSVSPTITSAWSDSQTVGVDSTPAEFTLSAATVPSGSAVTLLSPANGASGLRQAPVLEWAPSDNAAAGYLVELGLDATFTNSVAKVWTAGTRLRVNGFLSDNTTADAYYWRVYACQTGTTIAGLGCALVPPLANFRKSSDPVALDPSAVSSTADAVHLGWLPSSIADSLYDGGSRGYQVQVSASDDFAAVLVDAKVDAAQTALAVTGRTLSDGTYAYRVRRLDAGSTQSAWSAIGHFTRSMALPALDTPADSSVAPLLTWSPLASAKAYDLQYWLNGSSPSGTQGSLLRQTAFTPTAALAPGTYHWRVRQQDGSGKNGSYSAESTFVVTAAAPALLTPDAAQLALDERSLAWTAVPGAFRYKLSISTSSTFASTVTTVTTPQLLATPTVSLAYGTTYYWRVQLLNPSSQVLSTSASRAFTVLNVPAKVGTPHVTLTEAGFVVLWTGLTPVNLGAPTGEYLVRYRAVTLPESDWIVLPPVSSGTVSLAITGLELGTTYEAQVAAANSQGQGLWSVSVTATTPSAPSVPQGLSVSPTLNGLTLSWLAPATPGGTITSYLVFYRSDDAAPWTSKSTTARSITLTGLTGGLPYNVEVAAVNAVGEGARAAGSGTPLTGPGAPGKPVVKNGDRQVTLTWSAPTALGTVPMTGYLVQRRTYMPATKSWTAWGTAKTVGVSTRTATILSLVNGTQYEFRVSATTSLGSGVPSAASAAKPAAKPGAVKPVLKAVVGKITVSWTAPPTNGATITGYVIQRSTNLTSWTTAVTVKPGVRAWSWTNGTKGKRYYFRIGVKSNFPTVWGPSSFIVAS